MTWQISKCLFIYSLVLLVEIKYVFHIYFSVVTNVRMLPAPKVSTSNPILAVSTGYYMSVIIFIMAGFAGVAFFTIILLMCLKRRKRWKRRKRCANVLYFLRKFLGSATLMSHSTKHVEVIVLLRLRQEHGCIWNKAEILRSLLFLFTILTPLDFYLKSCL